MKVHWLTPRVALSGCVRYREDMAELAAKGVTHILGFFSEEDTCWETDPKQELVWAKEFGTELYRINRADDAAPWQEELLQGALSYAREALAAPGTKLLVHCMAGLSRSPVMAYGVLRHACAMEAEVARNLIVPLLAPERTALNEVYHQSMDEYLRQAVAAVSDGCALPAAREEPAASGAACPNPSSPGCMTSSPTSRAAGS